MPTVQLRSRPAVLVGVIVSVVVIVAAIVAMVLWTAGPDGPAESIRYHGRNYKVSDTPARISSDERPVGKTDGGGVIYVSTAVDPVAPITVDVRFSDKTVTYVLMGGP